MQITVAGCALRHRDTPRERGEPVSAPHELQHTGDQVHLCKKGEPTVVERERGPTREPPQPVSIDMGPHTYNGGGPDAVADTEEEQGAVNNPLEDRQCTISVSSQ